MKKSAPVIIFTGVQHILMAQFGYIDAILNDLRGSTFISGAAFGIDTYCCTKAVEFFPKARHVVVVPFRYKKNDVHIAWCLQQQDKGVNIEVLDMPQPKPRSKPAPIARNEYMVKAGKGWAEAAGTYAVLEAFPGGPDEVLRSGTWTTIRRARDAELRINLHPLVEADGFEWGGRTEE